MKCFKCDSSLQTIGNLILHLRYFHRLNSDDTFQCAEHNCGRLYSNLATFRKHMNNCHSPTLSQKPNEILNHTNANNITKIVSNGEIRDSNSESVVLPNPGEELRTDSTINKPELDLEREFAKYISALYNNPLIPRNVVQLVVDNTIPLLTDICIPALASLISKQIIPIKDVDNPTKLSEKMGMILNSAIAPIKQFNTEYRRLQYFEKHSFFITPKNILIGQTMSSKVVNDVVVIEAADIYAKFIPLRETLKAIFELPNFLQIVKDHVSALQSDVHILSNFIQGDIWKEKSRLHGGKTVFPLFLYFDDYEAGNALGSHSGSNKLGAVYVSVPCIPPAYVSRLDHIYVAMLFYSNDRKTFGNSAIFGKLIDELNYLKTEGVTIRTGSKTEIIYFELSFMLGDNLGLHSILGLVESFSANHCCRFCKIDKARSRTSCIEIVELLRTEDNYKNDLLLNDVSATGIKEPSIWNKVIGFHSAHNISVDVMHDVAEGVCKYVVTPVLEYLILEKKFFTLDALNARMNLFKYGHSEISNKPPPITNENLRNGIRMSASEMICFIRYLSLMVGDLVPVGDKVWELYLILVKIMQIVTSPKLHRGMYTTLQTLIADHHSLYMDLFKINLKPKFHHMVHYPRILRLAGPLVHYWCMRYESKHRQSKMYTNVCCSRKNLIHSLAMKHQLMLCHFIQSFNYLEKFNMGPVEEVDHSTVNHLISCDTLNIFRTKWVNISGTQYKLGMTVIVTINEFCLPDFGIISDIIIVDDEVYFIMSPAISLCFDDHYHAYQVRISTSANDKIAIKFKALPNTIPCLCVEKNSEHYIATRHLI